MITELLLSATVLVGSVSAEDALLAEQYRQANTDVFGFSTLEVNTTEIVDEELLLKLASIEAEDLD